MVSAGHGFWLPGLVIAEVQVTSHSVTLWIARFGAAVKKDGLDTRGSSAKKVVLRYP